MNYYRYLNQNKDMIAERLQGIFEKYRFESLNHTYDKIIVMKGKLADAFSEISELGIMIKWVSWFSDGGAEELQNDWYVVDEHTIERLIFKYDRKTAQRINKDTLAGVIKKLAPPIRHTQTDCNAENDSVTAVLWLLIPKDWQKMWIHDGT